MPGKPTERRRRPTQERAIATREHILTTAAALFAERGIAHTSTNRIAAAAEISIGTLYRYFADRDIIVDELLGRLQGELERGFAERVLDIPGLTTASSVADYTRVIAHILEVFAEVMVANAALVRALAGRVHFYRSGIPELEPRLRVLVKVVLIQALGPGDDREYDTMSVVLINTGFAAVVRATAVDYPEPQREEVIAMTARMAGTWMHAMAVESGRLILADPGGAGPPRWART